MKRVLLVVVVCCYCHPYGTTVHVQNNTPFEFSVSVKQVGENYLSDNHWAIYKKTIPPYSDDVEILGLGRNVGVKSGRDYIFISTLRIMNANNKADTDQSIILGQKLTGKFSGSTIKLGCSRGTFDNVWDREDTWKKPRTFLFKAGESDAFVQVKYETRYWAGKPDPYDDLFYTFSMPDAPSKASFDKGFYLTAHNAFATTAQGYSFAQQNLSVLDQLYFGARGLMIDTYEKDGKVVLVHGGFDTDKLIHPFASPRPVEDLLGEVVDFLRHEPHAIITIFLENYVKDWQLLIKGFGLLEPYLYKPADFKIQGNKWPSLGWMRAHNKRVVVFCPFKTSDYSFTDGAAEYFFDEWRYHIENQFSTIDTQGAAVERGSSKKYSHLNRTLYVFNFFPGFKITAIAGNASEFKAINSDKLREALNYAMGRGLGGKYIGQKPNFIAIDFINVGEGLSVISKWNGSLIY